jgi:hypothetical protein
MRINLILYLFFIRWFPTLRSYEYLSDLPIPNITGPSGFLELAALGVEIMEL